MRKLSAVLAGAALALSANAFALVTVTGDPVVVTETSGVYTFPTTTTYTTTSPYYYVTVGDTKRVCYRDVQPGLANVDVVGMSFRIGSDTVAVHCYDASPTYFQFTP